MSAGSGPMCDSDWGDRRTVLEAVKTSGFYLELASQELQADKEVVMEAVKRDGIALQYASDELRGDEEVMLAAIQSGTAAFEYASPKLKHDRAVVLEVALLEMRENRMARRRVRNPGLRWLSDELRADTKFMLEMVKRSGEALKYASQEARADKGDKKVVLEAVKLHGKAIEHASEELRADKEVVLEAVKQNGAALRHAAEQLRADRQVVVEALKTYSGAVCSASEELRADKDLQLLAARCCNEKLELEGLLQRLGVEMPDNAFRKFVSTGIAVRDEEAPVVAVSLSLGGTTPGNELGEGQKVVGTFECEASLMGGLTFSCSLPDGPCTDRWATERPSPILDMLAAKLIEELEHHFKAAKRVFITFSSDDGDAVAVTPWDWERPLSDFLKNPARRTA